MRIPIDLLEPLKKIASAKGMCGYQTLIKSYISEGLRRDEAECDQYNAAKAGVSTDAVV
jgi:predicted DNA binding CopG/RHH family protein